jgi:hypothetical protein
LKCDESEMSLEGLLDLSIAKSLKEFDHENDCESKKDKHRSLIKEFNVFELTGERTNNLEQLKDALIYLCLFCVVLVL